jgi:hypothetical protein
MAKFDRYCKVLYGSNPPTQQSSATLFENRPISPTSRQASFVAKPTGLQSPASPSGGDKSKKNFYVRVQVITVAVSLQQAH